MVRTANGRVRRPPSRGEIGVWQDYVETSEAIRRLLNARLADESGMSLTDYSVLQALSETEQHAMRSSELAAHIGWERSRLSHHLGRMEKRGLVRRDKCADDNRGALVTLTAEGLDLFRSGSAGHLGDVRELFFDAFTPGQLGALGVAMGALRTHLDAILEDE